MRRLWGLAGAIALALTACIATTPAEDHADTSEAPASIDSTAGTLSPVDAPTSTSAAPSSDAGDGGSITSSPGAVEERIVTGSLRDVTEDVGLLGPLTGMHGHAAAWGHANDDGVLDLVVGSFGDRPDEVYQVRGAGGPADDVLLAGGDGFRPLADLGSGRTSGAIFIDLDNDGDDELVLSRNVKDPSAAHESTAVFENQGGVFEKVADSGIGSDLGGRSIGALDFDLDGLVDLFMVEDRYAGGSSRLFRNLGGLRFVDVTSTAGIPLDVEGLGVATVDLSGDGRADIFVSGSNRLFVWSPAGFEEIETGVFEWETYGDEDLVAGVAAGDVDRDGRLDLVVGHHFNSTVDFDTEVPVRLYLNRTSEGVVEFVDVTEAAGLVGLPTKAPHVEFADMNNDGWPDIVTSASAEGGTVPAIFLHSGMEEGIPRFDAPEGLGSDQYWVSSPTGDYDGDGRRDVFAVEWYPELPSRLFHNELAAGSAIEVTVDQSLGGGIGTTVAVYEPGRVGEVDALIGFDEIVASVGYTAGVERVAHIGIGDRDTVSVVVSVPGLPEPVVINEVAAGARLSIGPDQAS